MSGALRPELFDDAALRNDAKIQRYCMFIVVAFGINHGLRDLKFRGAASGLDTRILSQTAGKPIWPPPSEVRDIVETPTRNSIRLYPARRIGLCQSLCRCGVKAGRSPVAVEPRSARN